MRTHPLFIPYSETGAFSPIVLDYLNGDPALTGFFANSPDLNGIRQAMEERNKLPVNRELLVSMLSRQYEPVASAEEVRKNIRLLTDANTFTICTAHQPNIFTGHLYFIYKILHSIKLAEELNESVPGARFVPVYYMGSEDADLEELGQVNIRGKEYQWQTNQQGAVGRMKVDQALLDIIRGMEGQLSIDPEGENVMALLKRCYTKGKTIEQATFELVHALFGKYGLIVFLPDQPEVKAAFSHIIKRELLDQFSQPLVSGTVSRFPEKYTIQVAGREINLFYLDDQKRERIVPVQGGYQLAGSSQFFTRDEILQELNSYPERFSPNVILRPLLQEICLPNIAFIGGGGELAYWLELKAVFDACQVPFPVLLLRNSFMLIDDKTDAMMRKLNISDMDVFRSTFDLQQELVKRQSEHRLDLSMEKAALASLYAGIANLAGKTDSTLAKHTEALQVQAMHKLDALEKKILRAARKRSDASMRQVEKIKSSLFPAGTLQERVDNIFPYLSLHGPGFIDALYENSAGLRHEFTILHI